MSGWQNEPFIIDVKAGDKRAFCMCGQSKNGPYCDGSHKDSGMSPKVVTFEKARTLYACGCGQSANKPYCDGSHKAL